MQIGDTLNNRYTITAHLGSGAMGEVYQATDSQTNQLVAVKVLDRKLTLDPEMVERFRREGEALRQLRHRHIVSFVDTFPHERQQVIVMEHVGGGSLHQLIRHGSLPVEQARQIAIDLCDALTSAHRLNIIHRDFKPENVLMAADGTPKLTDFGVARLVGAGTGLTGTGTQIGTPYYMSPEAWEGQPVDARTDIWSLGIVLYEMLAGEVPFGGETLVAVMNKVLTAPLPDLKKLRPETPPALVKIVRRMLERDPAKRYQSLREVALDLERTPAAPPAPAPPRPISEPPPSTPATTRPRISGWVWGVGGVLLLLIVGAGIWITLSSGGRTSPASVNPPRPTEVATNPPEPTTAPGVQPTEPPVPTVPMTPVTEQSIPAEVAALLKDSTIIASDDFSGDPGDQWDFTGSVINDSGGEMIMSGAADTWLGFKHPFKIGRAVVVRLRYGNDESAPEHEICLEIGDWQTATYKRFGVYLDTQALTNVYRGANRDDGRLLSDDLKLGPGSQFYVLVAGAPSGEFLVRVWDAVDSGAYGEYRESPGADWVQDGWWFFMRAFKGTLYVDDFMAIGFSGYR